MLSLIFLAGGQGLRMNASIPKQYLPLRGKPLALHSFETFLQIPSISEIVVVCSEDYQNFFPKTVLFAEPGRLRQHSVYSGLLKTTGDMVLIHDAARPFFDPAYLPALLEAAERTGAAALATPVTSTIKECTADRRVKKTLDRSTLWEIQTPQAIRHALLLKAFQEVKQEVTDDLSMIEAMGHPTELVPSSPRNFKITTPFDFIVGECAIN